MINALFQSNPKVISAFRGLVISLNKCRDDKEKDFDCEIVSCVSLKMVKCPRCLHYHYQSLNFGHEVGHEKYGKECLCNRCIKILIENWPDHPSVYHIIENLESRGLSVEDNPEN